jgi:hypothetical protein
MNTPARHRLHQLRFQNARFSVASLAGLLALAPTLQAQDEAPSRRPAQRDELPSDTDRRPSPFMVFDTNRDGILSAAEIDAAPAVLRRLDKNRDGKLSGEELFPRPPRPPRDEDDAGSPPAGDR